MKSLRLLWLPLLLASFALAQSSSTGTITNWEAQPYSQSAGSTRNQLIYTVHLGDVHYQVTRRRPTAELNLGQQVDCRVEGNYMFIRNRKGKEIKYEILGTDGETRPATH
jgi:hypothetical protein